MPDNLKAPRFLVVIPRFVGQPGDQYIFPVGIGYIAAVLKACGYFVKSLDLNQFTDGIDKVIHDQIEQHRINVVATGTISAHYQRVRAILQAARKAKNDIVTIVGGGVLSSEPELIYQNLNIDFGIIGEGEETVLELAGALFSHERFAKIPGLIYRTDDGRAVRTPERKPIRQLDDLPFPDDEFLAAFYESQPRIYNLVSSRSCPFGCTFCYHPIGRIYRQRSLDDVFREVEYSFNHYHPFHYRIIDELFSHNKERVVEFCHRIKAYGVAWDVQMRVSDVDDDLIGLMRESGCVLISYGLESGSQRVLDSMRKKTKVADIVRAVDMTYRGQVQVQGAYIFGDSAETRHTAVETLSLWLRQRHIGIGMWPIEVYPGAPLYHYAVKKGVIKDRLKFIEDGCPPINVSSLSEAEALRLSLLMYLLVVTYNTVPARIVSCEPNHVLADSAGNRQQRFDATVICPHCGEQQTHIDYPLYNRKKWSCLKCQRRFDVQPLSQWRHWPRSFEIATDYITSEQDSASLLAFFDAPLVPGNAIDMAGYSEIELLGVTYLIPTDISLRDIRYGLVQIFTIDRQAERLDPVVIYDNIYRRLHHPWYLKSRIAELVADWKERKARVSIVGIAPEIENIFNWTNFGEASVASVVLLDQPDATTLGGRPPRAVSLEQIEAEPPDVILIATTKTQKTLCEQLALSTSDRETEVTALYSSGTNF